MGIDAQPARQHLAPILPLVHLRLGGAPAVRFFFRAFLAEGRGAGAGVETLPEGVRALRQEGKPRRGRWVRSFSRAGGGGGLRRQSSAENLSDSQTMAECSDSGGRV